ncbi:MULTISPECIES: hypothetical protein [Cellulophaga]|jgi:hypothetical protein|uniref:Uncharacterized protein n=2 Tax=Cellulophaga baltica TaxID=76594 RepID=A0A1G7JR75_9FLAO|nr:MULTISPECIES: hypothetical protein [Cellulophaga]WFO16048.1 hypothetical protein M601_020600 [Cellulophaga baltica 4]AIY15137.1 hypothetical protein M667_19330 [Cellulophaga baltica NN016038]AIZ43503.1 hypothetical protein M666_19270 [Cellulophaga baltica 18]KGK30074.1 hypothetical protein EL45_12160 [Cellulophaga sp. E6(2014)]MBA6314537.1 hypothetical protein [Cellulophaga baltica]
MVTFFSVLSILVGLNAFLLLFSVNSNKKRVEKKDTNTAQIPSENIYPLNILETKYKKAV